MNDGIKFPVIDGHNDTLLNLYLPERGGGRSFFDKSDIGHIDLPRAREGGLAGGFFSLFVPPFPSNPKGAITITADGKNFSMAPPMDVHHARDMTTALMASLFRIVHVSDGRIMIANTVQKIKDCIQNGTLAVIMHLEGAEAIDPGLDALEVLHQAGLRSLGITWSRPNVFGYGVPFLFPHSPDTGDGLSDYGKALVRACNELHILIDCSHLNERGFWDVARLTDSPIVATHCAAHALCPSSRNLTDKQLDAIKESGGVAGISFFVRDLRSDGKIDKNTPLSEIIHHIDYIAGRIGIDHVAFGSDFDGAVMPEELGDASGLPKLIKALREYGFDNDALNKISHKNWIDVLKKTWHEE